MEALAYHEAGHTLMAVLLDIPIEKVAIGPRCTEPGFNGKVFVDCAALKSEVPMFVLALLAAASEPAERLAPSFDQFATLHRVHRHLQPFHLGVRNDLAMGFELINRIYAVMGLSERTVKQRFKAEYRDLAAALVELKANTVHQLARKLMRSLELSGANAVGIVRRAGPARGTADRKRLDAAVGVLRSDSPCMWSALDALTKKI